MASKYDSIKTAKDMVSEIMAHGLSMDQDDLNRVADIFGNDSIEELDRIANDIGRNNDNGEPDPKGSWSSNRRPTMGIFYSTIFRIWNWEEAVRFWNQHTNPEHVELVEMKREVKRLKEERDGLEVQVKHLDSLYSKEVNDGKVKQVALTSAVKKTEEKDAEIMALKAKLFDMMMAQQGRN